MKRIPYWVASLSILATLALSSAASAVTFTLLGNPGLQQLHGFPGDTITLDIRVEADAGELISGLGASVFGYDEAVIDFTSGDAVSSVFHEFALPGIGAFEGLSSLSGGALFESSIGANGNRVQIFNGVGLESFGAQPLDPGLDGVVGGGDAQFRLTFTAVAPGFTTFRVGTGYEGDAVVLADGTQVQANGFEVDFCTCGPPPIPEPGTALLMGLGLMGLSAGRQMERTQPS